ncbi:MAG: hypothetical protein HOW73_47905 [Polyangiaceae bacterium]|nr:hypothetical protein [Polyangiaceae bacterium]
MKLIAAMQPEQWDREEGQIVFARLAVWSGEESGDLRVCYERVTSDGPDAQPLEDRDIQNLDLSPEESKWLLGVLQERLAATPAPLVLESDGFRVQMEPVVPRDQAALERYLADRSGTDGAL